MTLKWHCSVQGQTYRIHVLLVSTRPTVHSISFDEPPFSRYRLHVRWNKYTEWPQNDIEQGQITLYMYNYSPRDSLYDQPFRNTSHFETSAPNDPRLTLNTTGYTYVPHICVTSIQSHISFSFALRPAVFKIQAILRTCTEWSETYLELYHVKLPDINVTTVPESQISPRVALRPAVFELQAFWD